LISKWFDWQFTRMTAIQSAHGGTLFLVEIADLLMRLQANLLRFLQTEFNLPSLWRKAVW
jgi:DNA-binding NtrC family response regulator